MNVITRLAVLLVVAGTLSGCGEPPSLVGKYSNQLSEKTLQGTFPGTSAPPGTWNLEVTEYDKIVVDSPDGGGFSLIIKSQDGDRLTLEATGCRAANGSKAGDAIYEVDRSNDSLRFSKVRDRCVEKDPEAALLTVKPWKRAGAD